MKQKFLIFKAQTNSEYIDSDDCAILIPLSQIEKHKDLIEHAAFFCMKNQDAGQSIRVEFLAEGYVVIKDDDTKSDPVLKTILATPDGHILFLEKEQDFCESIQGGGNGFLSVTNPFNKIEPEISFRKIDDMTGSEYFTSEYLLSRLLPEEEPAFG